MPIFEYRCNECNKKFEILHKSSTHQEEVVCPECNSKNNKKLLSSFSASVQGSSTASYAGDCSTGSCRFADQAGGCASGMCGLN
ncbi:MAG: FmdB family zinc ribbon protein [Ignavibacteriales bacterium]